MASNARKVSELGISSTLSPTDRVVVLTNPNTAIANTQTIEIQKFIQAFANSIPGPYANDSVASSSGISLKGLYYDTSGILRLRIT